MAEAQTPLQQFASERTVLGVQRLFKSRSTGVRVFWVVLVVGVAIMFSFQVILLLARYLAYPKKVTVEVVHLDIAFPSVTVCNMRNLDSLVLNEINRIFKTDSLGWNNQTDDPDILQYIDTVQTFYPMFIAVDNALSSYVMEVLTRATLASNIDHPTLVRLGVQARDFIVTCRMAGIPCDQDKHISRFFDPYYYNCYTYTPPAPEGRILAPGLENGVSLATLLGNGLVEKNDHFRLIPGIHESQSPMAGSEGVRVVIHPPDTTPYPRTEGFDVPPGYSASFGITARRNTRLGPPHGTCSNGSAFPGDPDGAYRLMTCQKLCMQKAVVTDCGCKEVSLPGSALYPELDYCGSAHAIPRHCSLNASEDCFRALVAMRDRMVCSQATASRALGDASLLGACGCGPPCRETLYDVTYSLSRWMTDSFDGTSTYMDIIEDFRPRFSLEKDGEEKYQLYSDYFSMDTQVSMSDFSRLNIYLADSSMLVTAETADYSVNQLLSDIGGQLGLWVGISVITVVEVIHLLVHLCHQARPEKPERGSPASQTPGDTHCNGETPERGSPASQTPGDTHCNGERSESCARLPHRP